jgi:hypothetical protein
LKAAFSGGNPLWFNHENTIPSGDSFKFPQKTLIVSPSLIAILEATIGGTRTMEGGQGD